VLGDGRGGQGGTGASEGAVRPCGPGSHIHPARGAGPFAHGTGGDCVKRLQVPPEKRASLVEEAFEPAPPRPVLWMQRQVYFIGAGALLVALALHCLVTRALPPAFVGGQVLLSGLFALLGLGLGAGVLSSKTAGTFGGALGMLVIVAFVERSGGPLSPYSQVFIGLPFLLAMFSPDSHQPTVVAGAASLSASVAVNVQAGMAPTYVLLHAMGLCVFVGFAFFSTYMYRRMLDAHERAHAERLEALAQLAKSELLRSRAERERAEVDRLVLVGQLASGVAHEVNNPLAYVKANLCHLLREGRDVDPTELVEVLTETQQGVLRIQQIVSDLRGFSRVGTLENERGCLDEALSEAKRLASMRLKTAGDVLLSLEPALPEVRLGQRHIVQVVLNLLLNAMDAVETARPGAPVRVCVRAWQEGGRVRLEVDDNGPGIGPEVMPHLFEPFFTTKPPGKGTGLGLALCREYVSRIGGSLHAENAPGGGARFVLLLPVAQESAVLPV
jgi:two-component system, NtrC family, sensor kinase